MPLVTGQVDPIEALALCAGLGLIALGFAMTLNKLTQLLTLAGEVNLWGAVTVEFGRVHRWKDRYEMTRVRVSGTAGLTDFVNALEGDLP